jgi:NAD(P)-dependent dehydrogenase (short-subunit alcohol dehydrogenase family)
MASLMSATAHLPNDWEPAAETLADRIILITGAADGIGRALACSCAKHGATVIMLDRNVRGLEQAYDEILAAGHPEPALYPLDLQGATPGDYATLAQTVEREFGRLHGLVHNAAFLGALIPLTHFDDELWYQVLQVNHRPGTRAHGTARDRLSGRRPEPAQGGGRGARALPVSALHR